MIKHLRRLHNRAEVLLKKGVSDFMLCLCLPYPSTRDQLEPTQVMVRELLKENLPSPILGLIYT